MADGERPQIIIFLMIALSLAMVSQVRYAKLPRIGLRSARGLLGLAVNLSVLGFGIFSRDIFFFPLGIAYATYGFGRAAFIGFLLRGEDEDEQEVEDSHPSQPILVSRSEEPMSQENGRHS